MTADGARAVMADPDRDHVFVVSLERRSLEGSIALEAHDEPGRLVEDDEGRVHVALRRGGAVVAIDPVARTVLGRTSVCAAPRGIAHDPTRDTIVVACAGGQIVTLSPESYEILDARYLDTDLRDVVVAGDRTYVSRFRDAELIVLDGTGVELARTRPIDATVATGRGEPADLVPRVAWRLRSTQDGRLVMLHQRAISSPIAVETSGYGGSMCSGGIVHAAATLFDAEGVPSDAAVLGGSVLPVDFDLAPDGQALAVALASAPPDGDVSGSPSALVYPGSVLTTSTVIDCASAEPGPFDAHAGQGIAVAYTADGLLLAQARLPATLLVQGDADLDRIDLDGGHAAFDDGHALFHEMTPVGMTCASCHPEGHEDGHVWDFDGVGARRTQSLLGGLLATAPFHWSGDRATLERIMESTFVERMGGRGLRYERIEALERWLDGQPVVPGVSAAADAIARGRAVFERADVGCTSCHAGEVLTDNRTVDVGTGGAFQVPSLRGAGLRDPYFHHGCAPTLGATIDGSCTPATQHGPGAALDAAELGDLIAYLASL